MINYYIFQEVIKDVDFGNLSTRYYCQDGKLHAGPPWDMDLTWGNISAGIEPLYTVYNEEEVENAKIEHREPILIRHFRFFISHCFPSFFICINWDIIFFR